MLKKVLTAVVLLLIAGAIYEIIMWSAILWEVVTGLTSK